MQAIQKYASLPGSYYMKNDSIKNIPDSIHQRLKNKQKETGRTFNELLQYHAIDGFLFRLSKSEHLEKLTLKGATMLRVWDVPITRPTRDIDFLGNSKQKNIEYYVQIVKDICKVEDANDGIVFHEDTVRGDRIGEGEEGYDGVRIHFKGNLGKIRLPNMQLDIGFDDIIPG